MEETDVCHSIPVVRAFQQAIPNNCTAKSLGPSERLALGVQALAGQQSITDLADQADVSRKFVYQQAAIDQARPHNRTQNLANVRIAGLDEILQNRQPVLVGADMHSTYCFLLSAEDQRDGDTWALRLLECQDRGFAPDATIADFGTGRDFSRTFI